MFMTVVAYTLFWIGVFFSLLFTWGHMMTHPEKANISTVADKQLVLAFFVGAAVAKYFAT